MIRLALASASLLLLTGELAAQRTTRTDDVSQSRRTAIVEASQKVSPAVVSLTVTTRRTAAPSSPFDFFFVPQSPREQQSFGTGFLIRPDGHIITNQHVVGGAEKIIVTLADGTDLPATLLGEDAITDIAVVRIERRSLPVVTIGHSNDLMIGEWVVALGNPFAYLLGNAEPTVTAGVVSATNRNILPGREQSGMYLDMIQTDASINPGNSGGPLANVLGEIVGVNSSIFTSNGGSIGLGFAIPIERALRVADEIISRGSVRRAWVGIDVAGPENIQQWKAQGGVLVNSVVIGGPGEAATIKKGDILTRANSRVLRNYLDWESVKLDLRVNDQVKIGVRRDGRDREVTLIARDLPTTAAMKVTVLQDLELVTLTAQVRSERNVQSDMGALIFSVSRTLSESTGLKKGDVIVGMNRRRINTADDVRDVIANLRSGQPLRVFLEREGQIVYSDLELK